MNLFEQLVREALRNTPELGLLQNVVEKELLHHDILRELSATGVLAQLTFMGGTCLRACYGSIRLSEDLDFYGGLKFRRAQLEGFPTHLQAMLREKYGLEVTVWEPKVTEGKVETWKVSICTRPERPDLPAQHINVDICALPSHDPQPMVLRNPYGVEMGTAGLIIRAASREEILADKFVALALRRGRVKYRDVWDIQWLLQGTIPLSVDRVRERVGDHGRTPAEYGEALRSRLAALESGAGAQKEFLGEVQRFLPVEQIRGRIDRPEFWDYLLRSLREQGESILDGWA